MIPNTALDAVLLRLHDHWCREGEECPTRNAALQHVRRHEKTAREVVTVHENLGSGVALADAYFRALWPDMRPSTSGVARLMASDDFAELVRSLDRVTPRAHGRGRSRAGSGG